MKRILLLAAAIVAAAPAFAGWSLLDADEQGEKIFIDGATISSVGQSRKVWVMNERPKADAESGVRSVRALYEVDCREKRVRIVQATFFKGSMGSGEVGWVSHKTNQWSYAAPQTIGQAIVSTTCL